MSLPIVQNNAGYSVDAVPVALVGSGGANSPINPISVVGALSGVVTGTNTRPADTTAYAIGDLIANNTVAGSVLPIVLAMARAVDKTFVMRRLRLKVLSAVWKAATIRVHLFKDSPTVSVGDNGVLNNAETYAFTENNYLGYQDIVLSQLTSDNYAKGFALLDIIAEPAIGTVNIFALLEARTAVTPAASSVFSLTLEALRD